MVAACRQNFSDVLSTGIFGFQRTYDMMDSSPMSEPSSVATLAQGDDLTASTMGEIDLLPFFFEAG